MEKNLYLQTSSGRAAWKDTGHGLADLEAGRPVVTNKDLVGAGGATNIAIECTDSAGTVTRERFVSYALDIRRVAPRLGPALVLGPPIYDGANGAACSRWPASTHPATGGATFTPRAQPLCSSSAPRATLPRRTPAPSPWPGCSTAGALLTEKSGPSSGHTSYFDNACIRRHVDRYLITLALPAVGTACAEEQ